MRGAARADRRRAGIEIRLLEKQGAFVESQAPEVLYSGAFGAGKSRALCAKALALAQRYPGTTVGLCRKTLVSLKATTLRTFLEEVCPPELIVAHNKSERLIAVRAGWPALRDVAYIHYFGLVDQQGESLNIRSLNLGACGVDECVELVEREWTELGGRCRDWRCGINQVFGATNPANRGHWAYQRFFVNPVAGRHHVIPAKTSDNPYLPASYRAWCDSLTGRYRDRYVEGKWVDFEGLVYDCFDPLVHCLTWAQFVERFGGAPALGPDGTPRIPPAWVRTRAIDFGYTNPFVCQWWAEDPDGRQFRYRELYHSRRLVAQHGDQMRGFPEPVLLSYADHDAEGRATLNALGIPTVPANKTVQDGVESVYRAMQPDPVTGEPRLYLLRGALLETDPYLVHENFPTCTEAELGSYQYPKGTDRRNPKEDPIKLHDHGCDAMRYKFHSERVGTAGGGLLRFMEHEATEARRAAALLVGRT